MRAESERILCAIHWLAALAVGSAFLLILGDIVIHGIGRISFSFIWDNPLNAGRDGRIFPMLVSTTMILCVCLLVAAPIGLGTAAFLHECSDESGRMGTLIRRSLDILAGVPSIVFGLFGYAFFAKALGMGFSILSGGLTLSCMVLPLFIRSVEEGLRSVPRENRQTASALGLSRWSTFANVILPSAAPGITVGLILSVGRALAETAALIFTSGYVDRFPGSLFDSGRSLSIHIYDLSTNVPGGNPSAYATALLLLVMLFAINVGASSILDRWLSGRNVRV